ncbi:MAG: hypothetical protein AB7S78_01985 [Candidatus Omnitrophota bacterium]
MPLSSKVNHSTAKAIIYSALLHFIILNLFILVVPTNKEPQKPVLVFFGALFQNTDLMDISSKADDHSSGLPAPVPNYMSASSAPYDDRAVPKPIYLEVVQPKPKITPKIFDNPENSKNSANMAVVEELHLPAVPAYKPLRFQTK